MGANMRFCKHRQYGVGFVILATLCFFGVALAKEKETAQPAPPTFSPTGGLFTKSIALQLSSSTQGGVIRYTLCGTEPRDVSPVYSKPISIEANTLVRAKVFVGSATCGSAAAETYT